MRQVLEMRFMDTCVRARSIEEAIATVKTGTQFYSTRYAHTMCYYFLYIHIHIEAHCMCFTTPTYTTNIILNALAI